MFTARYVLHSMFCPHSVFMCFVWIWEQTAIIALYSIDWLVFITETECLLRGTFYILPTHCVYVFCVDLRTNSDYFTVQHWLVVFMTETECVYCAIRSTFCPHSVFMCFVWIWEQTAIISLYSIDWWFFWPRRSVFTAPYRPNCYSSVYSHSLSHFITPFLLLILLLLPFVLKGSDPVHSYAVLNRVSNSMHYACPLWPRCIFIQAHDIDLATRTC